MIKKLIARAGILTAVFILAVIGFSYLTNRSNTDMSADMGNARLPGISFVTEGYPVNALPGYKEEMVIPTMRDTITPVANQKLEMQIRSYDSKVEKAAWQVYTLDGEQVLLEEEVKNPKGTVELKLSGDGVMLEERVLKVTLYLEDEEVHYYTRIADTTDCNYGTCLNFVKDFFEKERDKSNQDALSAYLEKGADSGSGCRRVTINSDISNVTWGNLAPEVQGDVRWEIKECNPAYTALKLYYAVTCPGAQDDPEALYNVEEFFRVRIVGEKQYLMDYERTMDQIFDAQKHALNEKGVLVGMADPDIPYMKNSEGNIVSFVQADELWSYDKGNDSLALDFSFARSESQDVRHLYNRHDIKIISVDKNGSTTFTVCGYMNRGIHEGRVGAAVYYYDAEKNSVNEKAIIPSRKGYHVMKEELGRLVYYSSSDEKLYIMSAGALYCIDMKEDTREVLVRGLGDDQYQVSEDGHLLAYQSGGGLNDSQKITVLNLQNGKSFELTADADSYIKPIGFIRSDFVYGTMRGGDAGVTNAGQSVFPMYKLDIVNQKQKVVKIYEVQDIYILGGYIEGNMLTLDRALRNESVYTAASADYITNNEKVEESNIMLETYKDEVRGTLLRLTFEDGISDSKAKLLQPKMVLYDKANVIELDESEAGGKYYVYACGEQQGVYDNASYAVKRADEIRGTAVTSRQAYLWERGNRSTIYEVDNMDVFTAGEGESTLAACLRRILEKEGKQADVVMELANGASPKEILDVHSGGEGLDLTGCTTEEILYTISRETPVIAVAEGGHAVLLIGYNQTNVAYLDPADGQRYSVSKTDMENMVRASGNTFIGYAK